ncbi:MAG TPA: aldose 1-epimerase family protein [Planctomycetes bacterium]|nr:aldose 1-epimerase family protein [Planctomycetota bacterium]
MAKKRYPWKDKICNTAQVGGIETSVLDNGLGKGVRVAWVNTGTGLRYKVVIDRGMDIAEAFYNEHSLAWLSHAGVTAPRPDSAHDLEWLYSFGGGFLATCGLTHAGGPEKDKNEERGLHGRINNIPASIESIVQPDLAAGNLEMSITGVVKQTRLFGVNYELRRTISSRLGEPAVRIHDVVTNLASQTMPHMMLYHCNFGWPLVDEGADLIWKGKCKSRGLEQDDELFASRHNYKKCQKPLTIHKGREACGFVDVKGGRNGNCTIGINNKKLKMALVMKYNKKNLPWMCNWQHWGFGDYVCALEPGTNPPIGQIAAGKQRQLVKLGPGKSRTYELEISILTDRNEISKFVNSAGG